MLVVVRVPSEIKRHCFDKFIYQVEIETCETKITFVNKQQAKTKNHTGE